MIHDVDETLKALLVQKAHIDTRDIDIKFEMPTRDWSVGFSKPTVNVYLYDVRENVELRSNERYLTRTDTSSTLRRSPVRVDLSYLITVWTQDISDEHRLLGDILTALLSFPLLPQDVLRGSMQTQPLPLHAWIAQPERTPNPWDFWGHLEHRMKSGLSYVVTASLEPHPAQAVQLVSERKLTVEQLPLSSSQPV